MNDRYSQIKSDYPIQNVVGLVVTLRPAGKYYTGKCPFHSEKTGSFTVNPKVNKYHCYGCGAHGDIFDFVKRAYKLETDEQAIAQITGTVNAAPPPALPPPSVNAAELDAAICIMPAPKPSQITHPRYGAPAMRFDYNGPSGEYLYSTCRFDISDGKKVILPFSYWQTPKRKTWLWRGVPTPRPLYGLDRLASNPGATVVVVEGEKCADAAQRLLPHVVAVTWCGGTNNVKHHDWSPLAGRRIILWPDADWSHEYGDKHERAGEVMDWQDQPGNLGMIAVATAVQDNAPRLMWVVTPTDQECGWDVADAEKSGWTPVQCREFVKGNIEEIDVVLGRMHGKTPKGEDPAGKAQQQQEPEEASEPEPPVEIDYEVPGEPPVAHTPRQTKTVPGAGVYYRPLGYELSDSSRTLYWFFNFEKQAALCFASGSLSRETSLFEIAPLEYWETYFHKKGGKIDLQAACHHLMAACTQKGFFRPGDMRGRGAWMEPTGPIYNTGAAIVTGGTRVAISDFSSRFAYSRGDEIQIEGAKDLALSDDLAREMATAFQYINFERLTSRYLLAGWCVLAPFCGVLDWRSHVWVNGGAGTGKTWVLANIIRRMLGEDIALYVQGNTTEPGIRQSIGNDARPCIFDEAEAEDEVASLRIKSILELARASSYGEGGGIAKGSTSRKAQNDKTRIMFCFSSIVVAASQDSDVSRITNITLVEAMDEGKDQRWATLQRETARLFTDEHCRALRARTLVNLPTILANIKTFSAAFREILGDQRASDQLGTLLAGAWSLHLNKAITLENARAVIAKHDWRDDVRDKSNTDADRLLARLREHIVSLDVLRGRVSMTVGEMIECANGNKPDDPDTANYDFDKHLGRMGIIVEDGCLLISNSSSYIKTILQRTPWSVNWNKILMRIPGAQGDKNRRFATVQSRAVAIPLARVGVVPWPPPEEAAPTAPEEDVPF